MKQHFHVAAGIEIASTVPLRDLPRIPSIRGTDVLAIRPGRIELVPTVPTASGCKMSRKNGHISLWFDGVGSFEMIHGREIIVSPDKGVSDSLLSLYVVGPVLAVSLHQRGLLILHGSAVDFDGKAVGFIGKTGSGKSTLAAGMNSRGRALLADDLLAISVSPHPTIFPTSGSLRLWPDSLRMLGKKPDDLPQVLPKLEKRFEAALVNDSGQAYRLDRLYILGQSGRVGIQMLDPQFALARLLENTYLNSFLDLKSNASEFQGWAKLAAEIPVYLLNRSDDWTQFRELLSIVEASMRNE